MLRRKGKSAISPVLGAMLIVGITITLSALVYLMVAGYPALLRLDPGAAYTDIEILEIYDDGDASPYPNCKKSCMVLINRGVKPLNNRDLMVKVYTNGEPVDCNIFSLHGQTYNFSPLRHGVERIVGEGARGETWNPGEELLIDFRNGTFRPGDVVHIEIISASTGMPVSSDSYHVT